MAPTTFSRFDDCLPHVLVYEGGKVNNPKDPGGKTNQGITQNTFRKYLISGGKPVRDVFGMTDVERNNIYRTMFWAPIHGDDLGAGVDMVVFDGAVNSGPIQAVKWLQRALGTYYTGKIDGMIGRVTIEAVESFPDKVKLINAICDRRLNFLESLSTFATFGNGWKRRVGDVRVAAVNMARALPVKAPLAQINHEGSVKAQIEDAKRIPTGSAGTATATTGGSTASIGLALEAARDAITPLAGGNAVLTYIVVALVISGLALTVGGFVWKVYAGRKAAKLIDHLNLVDTPNVGTIA